MRQPTDEIRFRGPREGPLKQLQPISRGNAGSELARKAAATGLATVAFAGGTILGSAYELGTMFQDEPTAINRSVVSSNLLETLDGLDTGSKIAQGVAIAEVLTIPFDLLQYPFTHQDLFQLLPSSINENLALSFLTLALAPLAIGTVLPSLRKGLVRGLLAAEGVYNAVTGK